MKKGILLLCIICLFGCSTTTNLHEYEKENNGFLYYLEAEQPKNAMRIYVASDHTDIITKLKVSTTYDQALLDQYFKGVDPTTFFQAKELDQQANELKDKDNISGYGNYDEITSDKQPYPFFSTVYESMPEESYNLEILMFNFCVKDLDITKKENKALLKRYGLWDAYDKETGFLSYKKLSESKKFQYHFYFEAGVKETFKP